MSARPRSNSGADPLELLARPEPLRWHAALTGAAAGAAVIANLLLSPARLWSTWLVLALGVALAAHGSLVLARALRARREPTPVPVATDSVTDVDANNVVVARPESAAPRFPEAAPRIDPGPPIFPDEPVAARARRWIPRAPEGPSPSPRTPAFPGAIIRPMPSAWGEDVEIAAARQPLLWPTWEPAPAGARSGDVGWAAGAALPDRDRSGADSSVAGW